MLGYAVENKLKAVIRVAKPPGKAPEGRFPVRKNGKFGFVNQSCAESKKASELCASSRLHCPILETASLLEMCS